MRLSPENPKMPKFFSYRLTSIFNFLFLHNYWHDLFLEGLNILNFTSGILDFENPRFFSRQWNLNGPEQSCINSMFRFIFLQVYLHFPSESNDSLYLRQTIRFSVSWKLSFTGELESWSAKSCESALSIPILSFQLMLVENYRFEFSRQGLN